jgi:ABC-2 type transport system permease protein
MFEATVGTSADQIAVAPGGLKRTWMARGRRYFHYATDAPVGEAAFFSAKYARRDARWNGVAIEVFHHPAHTANVDRIIRSAQASLDYHTKHFGPYPHSVLRFIEHPGLGIGMHADASQINYSEGSALLNPAADERGFDLAYAVIAHEVAHQWWGGQLPYAAVQGLGLLSESPAWYTAMGVVKEAKGEEELRRLRRFFRQPYPILPIRQSVPLLRSLDPYAFYRKGPAALWALRDAIGEERVNTAYRRLLEKHRSGEPPLPTSLDLYRELKAVTPPEFQTLLHDLFEANTFWEMKAERATAKQITAGTWQVTLDLDVRKEVVNPAGVATPVPMDDLVEIGVFAPAEKGERLGRLIYLQKHRIRAGKQTITVTVPEKPGRAGIDPYHLLIEWERDDNGAKVRSE